MRVDSRAGEIRVSLAVSLIISFSSGKKWCLFYWQLGSIFDGWGEHLNYQNWLNAFKEAGLESGFYAQRERSLDEPLPWAHIDFGVTPSFLKRECQLAIEG
jgi:hypothetical protein